MTAFDCKASKIGMVGAVGFSEPTFLSARFLGNFGFSDLSLEL